MLQPEPLLVLSTLQTAHNFGSYELAVALGNRSGFQDPAYQAKVLRAATSACARARAKTRHRAGYGSLVSVQKANAQDCRLICQGTWLRRRRNGSSPQFGSRAQKGAARRQRSRYHSWL